MSLHTLVLSPHLDDAVLSCGGWIHRQTATGHRVLVVTLFTGDLATGDLADEKGKPLVRSKAMKKVLKSMDLPVAEAMARRRREDEDACSRLGAERVHADLPEALVRADGEGAAIYPKLGQLFGPIDPRDGAVVDRVVDVLRGLPTADEVIAPLAVGGHVDHRVVRQAAEQVFGSELWFYEDFPYVANQRRAVQKVLGWRKPGWTAESRPVPELDLNAKMEGIVAYKSQVGPLFGGQEAMETSVRRWTRLAGGERFWRRV